jgi:hypothetical protein
VENDLLGGPAAEQDGDPKEKVVFRVGEAVLGGRLLGCPQREAAGDDRDFLKGVGARQESTGQGMPGLVIGCHPFFFLARHLLAFLAQDDLIPRQVEIARRDHFLVLAGGEEGGFVH